MQSEFSYNQAVFGLMLLGAKADGKLQDEEKKLLVDLTSEEHPLSAEEYKYVINEAKNKTDIDFSNTVYTTLNEYNHQERIKALYWLLQLIESDVTSNDNSDSTRNEKEWSVYNRSLLALHIKAEEVGQYAKTR